MALPSKYPLLTLLGVENQHAAQVRKILTMSANRLEKDIKKLGKAGNEITRMQMQAQRASIHAMLNEDFTDMQTAIQQGKIAAAKAASGVVSQYENQLLKAVMSPAAMQNLANAEAARAASGLNTLLARVSGSSYIPLSKQVYKTQQMTLGWVDARINQALVSGWSAAKLASEIKGMVDPNTPGGVSYAANRLARTEINNAFHATSAERYLNSSIVEEVDWKLSTSHPEGDICDSLAADGPYQKKSVPQKPHPHCYCFITPKLPSEAQFLKNLEDGKYDDGEEWPKAMKADPDPTYNTLAKQYKIKADVLQKSGATPQQLQAFIAKQDIKALNTIKKNLDGNSFSNYLGFNAKKAGIDPLPPKAATVKTAKAAAKAVAPKTPAAAKEVAAKVQTKEEMWLNKPAPVKPAAPVKPPTVGDKAFDEWEAKVAKRFSDFAKASGNAKTDITKSLNYSQVKLVRQSSMDALNSLKANKYIDDVLYEEGKAAMKASAKMLPKDAAAFKKALAEHAKAVAEHDVNIVDWRAVNGIVSNAKGMDGALVHKTNSAGVKWANENLKVAQGAEQAAARKYSGSSYGPWNDDLRTAASDALPGGKYKTATASLDNAMAPIPEDVILHRGTNWDEFMLNNSRTAHLPPPAPTDLIGSVQTNYGYSSTSVGQNAAFSGKSVQIRIRVPAGHKATWVEPYSANQGEREVLLSRGTSLYIHDLYEVKGTYRSTWVMEAEVVPIGEDASLWTPMASSAAR